MNIKEAVAYYSDRLSEIYEKGEAAAISDLVIEHVSGIKKTDRASQQKKSLTPEQLTQLDTHLQKLLEHQPVQYVLKEAWFCGLKFSVDKNVLIPRPETEELVEWIITNCKFPVSELKILDVGSGSGCIPIALKRRLGKAEVWSCDVSQEALGVAIRNAESLGVDVNFVQLDFLSAEQRNKLPSFDIIVSNPPYILHQDRYGMPSNVLEYEPAKALFVPDNDPLVFYRAIADFGREHLKLNGSIYTEINEKMGAAIVELFASKGYSVEIRKDMQGKERMVLGVRF